MTIKPEKPMAESAPMASCAHGISPARAHLLLILILLFGFILRMGYFDINRAVFWDAAEYLLEAKKIAFNAREAPEAYASHRGILMPIIWASIFKIGLGEKTILFSQIIVYMLTIVYFYRLGKTMFDASVGLLAALLLSVFWQTSFWAHRAMTEIPALFFFTAALYYYWQAFFNQRPKCFILFFAAVGLGILVRYPNGMVLPLTFGFLLLVFRFDFIRNRFFQVGLIFSVLLAVAGLVYVYVNHGDPFHMLARAPAFFSRGGWHTMLGYVRFMPDYLHSTLLTLLVAALFYYPGVLIYWQLPAHAPPPEGKRTVLPLLFLLFSCTLLWIIVGNTNAFLPRMAINLFVGIFLLIAKFTIDMGRQARKIHPAVAWVWIILILATSMLAQLLHAHQMIMLSSKSYQQLKVAGLWLKQHSSPDQKFLSHAVNQLSYYSQRKGGGIASRKKQLDAMLADYDFYILTTTERNAQWQLEYPRERGLKVLKVFWRGGRPTVTIYDTRSNP